VSVIQARGLVVRQVSVGEADRLVTLFLKGVGLAAVSAKGARKPKSRFLAGTEIFTYADFVLFDGGAFMSLNEADIIEPFYALREDYDALRAAAYIADICCRGIPENYPCDDILLLALRALKELCAPGASPARAVRVRCVFELKFLQLNGCLPEAGELAANIGDGGDFMRMFDYIAQSGTTGAFRFKCSEAALNALNGAARGLMEQHYDFLMKKRPE